jgi:hypothetical protein
MTRKTHFEEIAPVLDALKGKKLPYSELESLVLRFTSLFRRNEVRGFIGSLFAKGWVRIEQVPEEGEPVIEILGARTKEELLRETIERVEKIDRAITNKLACTAPQITQGSAESSAQPRESSP